ncbi:MAG: hypothetical protein AAF696_35120, partial [Bacteroidota bacterium]
GIPSTRKGSKDPTRITVPINRENPKEVFSTQRVEMTHEIFCKQLTISFFTPKSLSQNQAKSTS